MPELKVAFNKDTYVATVLDASGSVPSGSVNVGTFFHPDETYPDSYVIYHGVRELLYKRSEVDPAQPGFWPENITNMQAVTIDNKATARLVLNTSLPRVVSTIEGGKVTLSVVALGGKAPLKYKWEFRAPNASTWTAVSGQTTANLVLDNIDADKAGEYKVTVTDAAGTSVDSTALVAVGAYPPPALTGIKATPTSLSLSVATDAAGKTVALSAIPTDAELGTLSIKTAPDSARATATISGSTLTVKPVAAGAATSVVVTNGKVDVTITINVAA
ncbi:Hoc-like head decoration [Shigella virus Moo19]|uniref:Ig-like domain-containing protein n=1 Tax=Shigella virus Moo19 TaxID=2886042 RepID=A0AAE8YCJ7_9CAUD|nr:Hoc-like head decoration [Shigella virus Moo19]UEN68824.1 hypothetical protein Moo19_gp28 [Shigella virus Moo19]